MASCIRRPLGNRVDTPDTFSVVSQTHPQMEERQAFLWLTGGKTIWMLGTFDADVGQFTGIKSASTRGIEE